MHTPDKHRPNTHHIDTFIVNNYNIIMTSLQPVTFMRVTATHNETKSASKRTLKRRCQEMSHVRDIVSGGEASTLLENEIKWMSDDEKHHLLVESGIAMDIKVSAEQGLAIKAGLAIPWHKLRHLRR